MIKNEDSVDYVPSLARYARLLFSFHGRASTTDVPTTERSDDGSLPQNLSFWPRGSDSDVNSPVTRDDAETTAASCHTEMTKVQRSTCTGSVFMAGIGSFATSLVAMKIRPLSAVRPE